MIDPTTQQLLAILHRGGAHAYWWTMEGRRSFWWDAGKPTALPGGQRNVYVGVHPTSSIPQTNPRGERKPAHELRAQLPIIAALNCLYTELDAKDFGGDKDQVRIAADAITPPPSVLVDSGGGYHLYWLFDETWILTDDESRTHAKALQAAWVAYTGGDKAVKDLARVLRVPGTLNLKYEPPRKVAYVYADFGRRYTPDTLEAICGHLMEEERLPQAAPASYTGDDRDRRYAQGALDREVAGVMRAQKGLKHDAIRDAAIRLGTLAGRGLLDDDQIIDELTRAADLHRTDVKDTYRTAIDGLAYGKMRPRDPRKLPSGQLSSNGASTPQPNVALPPDEADSLPLLLPARDLGRVPPARELIPNLLYLNTLHQLFGAPGSGKSFLALDIAGTAAQTYPVIYIAAEAIEDYEGRVDAWQAHHGRSIGDLYFWRRPLSLADEGAVHEFIAAVLPLGPALIVIDPLADCMTGLDESTMKDMGLAVFALNTIRRHTHAAILIVHHTGWDNGHERGSSTLRGACRMVVKVDTREDGLIRFLCEKKNHGRKFDPRSFRLISAGTRGGALPLPARQVLPGKLRLGEKLLRAMEALTTEPLRKGASHTDLVKDTSFPAGTVNRIITALVEAGYIQGFDVNGRLRQYTLTTAGKDALEMAFEERSEVWNSDGRTLEESGRTYNWQVVSSTVSEHNKAVLPNASINASTYPPFPPLGGEGGGEEGRKVLPLENQAAEYHPPVHIEATAIGFRELDFPDVTDDRPLFEDEDEVSAPAEPEPTPVGLNWEHLRGRFAAHDIAGIQLHCSTRRADFDTVLAQLETEAGT